MRNNPRPAEKRMWELLESEVIPNFPKHIFLKQYLLFGYILDFYCPTLRICIEMDGRSHDDRQDYDDQRDKNLERYDIKIFRFSNSDVFSEPMKLCDLLCRFIEDRIAGLTILSKFGANMKGENPILSKDIAARERSWNPVNDEMEPQLPRRYYCPKCGKNPFLVKINYYSKCAVVSCPCFGSYTLKYSPVYEELDYYSKFCDLEKRGLV